MDPRFYENTDLCMYIWHENRSETVYETKELQEEGSRKKGAGNGLICSLCSVCLYGNVLMERRTIAP